MVFSRSNLGLSLDFSFDHFNTNQKNGVSVSLSANNGRYKTSLESSFSKNWSKYAFTGQIKGFSNLSAGLEVQNNPFKQLLSPSNVINKGCKLDIGRVEGKMWFCVLPFETLKDFVTSDSDQTDFDSGSLPSKDQDKLEFVFRQKESKSLH